MSMAWRGSELGKEGEVGADGEGETNFIFCGDKVVIVIIKGGDQVRTENRAVGVLLWVCKVLCRKWH